MDYGADTGADIADVRHVRVAIDDWRNDRA
jgi:hypothetical protein